MGRGKFAGWKNQNKEKVLQRAPWKEKLQVLEVSFRIPDKLQRSPDSLAPSASLSFLPPPSPLPPSPPPPFPSFSLPPFFPCSPCPLCPPLFLSFLSPSLPFPPLPLFFFSSFFPPCFPSSSFSLFLLPPSSLTYSFFSPPSCLPLPSLLSLIPTISSPRRAKAKYFICSHEEDKPSVLLEFMANHGKNEDR